jgi:hypothetical protein
MDLFSHLFVDSKLAESTARKRLRHNAGDTCNNHNKGYTRSHHKPRRNQHPFSTISCSIASTAQQQQQHQSILHQQPTNSSPLLHPSSNNCLSNNNNNELEDDDDKKYYKELQQFYRGLISMSNQDDEAMAAADKEMEERANRAKQLLSQRYKGLRSDQVRAILSLLYIYHTIRRNCKENDLRRIF